MIINKTVTMCLAPTGRGYRILLVLMTIASLDRSITNVPHLMGLKGGSSCS
ncbi:hypothetical protein Esi_0002_0250 [Ectocarpus siliculosus]|uniref:Uncharacterized protein n=1 Tax=Ectocarpus siliculosus TaxID=2880 RepID=D7FQA5_ECTSI|nr:hypothetical protein Esi_0002_0250 [Ectocarpus siliculosus]|eukprot:CBJ48437.1 hypothetical protein Esi_0002_0250 [Ectocarpus siliculosus]